MISPTPYTTPNCPSAKDPVNLKSATDFSTFVVNSGVFISRVSNRMSKHTSADTPSPSLLTVIWRKWSRRLFRLFVTKIWQLTSQTKTGYMAFVCVRELLRSDSYCRAYGDYMRRGLDCQLDLLDHTQLHSSWLHLTVHCKTHAH
jgi:hypothetical protein